MNHTKQISDDGVEQESLSYNIIGGDRNNSTFSNISGETKTTTTPDGSCIYHSSRSSQSYSSTSTARRGNVTGTDYLEPPLILLPTTIPLMRVCGFMFFPTIRIENVVCFILFYVFPYCVGFANKWATGCDPPLSQFVVSNRCSAQCVVQSGIFYKKLSYRRFVIFIMCYYS